MGLLGSVIELTPSEVPGRDPCPTFSPGLVNFVCCPCAFPFAPRFDESRNPRLVDGLDMGGRWDTEEEGRGASNSSSA